jgi:hypothetical protein
VESASERKRKAESREMTRRRRTGAWRSAATGARGITGSGGGGGRAYAEQGASPPPGQSGRQSSGASVQLRMTVDVAACGRTVYMAGYLGWDSGGGGGVGSGSAARIGEGAVVVGWFGWAGDTWSGLIAVGFGKVWRAAGAATCSVGELDRMDCRRRLRLRAPNTYDFANSFSDNVGSTSPASILSPPVGEETAVPWACFLT